MRGRYLLGVAVLALGTGTAGAQTDPAPPNPKATLGAPRSLDVKDTLPSAPQPPGMDPGAVANSNQPAILPGQCSPTAGPCCGNGQAPSQACGEKYQAWEPGCGPEARFWVGADYMLWWMRSPAVPVLVTTGPASSAGILGQQGTTVLAGGSNVNQGAFSGLRLGAGCWLDELQTVGIEGNWFTLGSRSWSFTAGNNGDPGAAVIARPFFNALSNSEDSELVAVGGLLAGTVLVNESSRLDGWEANGLFNLCCSCNTRFDLLVGFRSLELNDGLTILEDLTVLPSVPGLGGNHFQVADEFHTRSTLYAGQLGARLSYQYGSWDTNLTGKVALGSNHEEVAINGFTGLTPAGGATTVLSGGLLALPSNIGSYSRDVFAVVPEVGLSLGYWLTNTIHIGAGYSFLYWSNVVRAGDQIDRVVNPLQVPALQGAASSATRPAFTFNGTDFWAHGLTCSLEFRF
jgi:hypothetical protein